MPIVVSCNNPCCKNQAEPVIQQADGTYLTLYSQRPVGIIQQKTTVYYNEIVQGQDKPRKETTKTSKKPELDLQNKKRKTPYKKANNDCPIQ